MSECIRDINFILLRFPTSHFISGWKCIRETWHLISFVKLSNSVYGVGEGTPYGTNIWKDYNTAVKLKQLLLNQTIDEAIKILNEIEYKMFLSNKRITYGAFLTLESALLDALAKLKDTSIADLLGVKYRDQIPIAGTIFLKHPYKMAEEINMWISKGITHLKIKIPCSLDDLEKFLNIIVKKSPLKEKNLTLRVDANQCFEKYDKAFKALKIMEKYGVNIVEQPLPKNALKEIAKLRKHFYPIIKIMLDESLVQPWDIKLFAELEATDIVNFHPSKLGCLSITRKTILHTKKLGMEAQIGSALMTEIGLIHHLNLAASIPELDYPLEEIGLCNTTYGYGVMRNPPILNTQKGFFELNRHIEIKDLCLEHMKPFSYRNHFHCMKLLSILKHIMFRK